jgi:ATP-dependent Clp protease ATP-binding subunit ClpC
MSDLSPAVELAWQIAASEAGGAGHAAIEPAHLLIGLLSLEKALRAGGEGPGPPEPVVAAIRAERAAIAEVLSGAGLDAADLRRTLRRRVGRGPGGSPGRMSRSAAAKAAFQRAAASSAGTVTGLHLLAALLATPDETTRDMFAERRVDVEALLRRACAYAGVPGTPEAKPGEPSPAAGGDEPSTTPTLDRYSRDLTRLAARGELGPVIGRRDELLQVLQTLARRSKNNPVLVGEAGVGKTAIVEALAIRAAAGKDEEVLGGKRIVELNLGALLGGTDYRGELEKRLTRILDEARADSRLIVFIDEIHTVVGAGRVGAGGTDVANIL